ncbi:hypothetical protein EAH87_12040 [Sphingomonas koreensis]|nr:hypothetical protein EAH87_12040 [Sphingomonas koreensis]
MSPDDIAYYQARAQQERDLAHTSEDDAVAKTHLWFAEQYERRLKGEPPASQLSPETHGVFAQN